MKRPRTTAALVVGLALALNLCADENLNLLKSKTDRWIAIQQQLAQDRSAWTSDKSVLVHTIATLEASRDALAQRVQTLETQNSTWAKDRQVAEALLAEHLSNEDLSVARVTAFEQRLQNLAGALPDPLKEKLRGPLQKIQAAQVDEKPNTAGRIQNLLAILARIDEFNNTITHTHVTRELTEGDAIDVRVMYWGLAFAYAINGDGARAWMILPESGAWRWVERDQDAPAIQALFDVYEKTATPTLVAAPAQLALETEADR